MKNSHKLIIGLLFTAAIYLISGFLGKYINPKIPFFYKTFGLHSIMLVLSIISIVLFKKQLDFKMKIPKLKTVWKPVFLAIFMTIFINVSISIMTRLLGGHPQPHPAMKEMNINQIIVFVFFYASIAEEFLHRGFLLNLLKPFKSKGITLFKRHISLSVIIAGLSFGLMHLGTIRYGVSYAFLVQIVTFTSVLGVLAGYYQEKYDNFSYAILVHMSGNLLGVLSVFVMNLIS